MSDDAGRPQDQGRRHRRRSKQSAATSTLLAAYQEAMRDELRAVLVELRGAEPAPGLALDGKPAEPKRPALDVRMRLWDLAIKLGRELGTAVDATPATSAAEPTAARTRSRRRVDYGGA